MSTQPRHWLVKQEPAAYSWEQFVQDKGTAWTGVRNFQARNNLQSMQQGDQVLFYHSVTGKAVVGLARVTRIAYPDPTAPGENWVCVNLEPVAPLAHPVSLDSLKTHPFLKDIPLVKQSRLSVMPLTEAAFEEILRLGSA